MKKAYSFWLFLVGALGLGFVLGLFSPILNVQQPLEDNSLLSTSSMDGASQLASSLENKRLILRLQATIEKSNYTSESIMLELDSIQRQLDQLGQGAPHENNPELAKKPLALKTLFSSGGKSMRLVENTDAIERFIDDDDDDVNETSIEVIENVIGDEALSHLSLNEVKCKNTICMITYDGDLAGPNLDGDMVMAKLFSNKLGNRNYTIDYSEDEFGKKSMFLEFE
jgi:hypothetical protein